MRDIGERHRERASLPPRTISRENRSAALSPFCDTNRGRPHISNRGLRQPASYNADIAADRFPNFTYGKDQGMPEAFEPGSRALWLHTSFSRSALSGRRLTSQLLLIRASPERRRTSSVIPYGTAPSLWLAVLLKAEFRQSALLPGSDASRNIHRSC